MGDMIARTEQAITNYDSALLDNLDLDDAVKMIIGRLTKEKQRAAQLETRITGLDRGLAKSDEIIAQLEAERNAAWLELREIREAINADRDEATIDEVRRVVYERDEARNQIAAAIRARK